jgi:predicted membrane protein
MKGKNLFWGIFFLALAGFIIASQLGAFGTIGVWSLLEGILLVSLIIFSLVKLNFFGVFIPAAFLYMIFWKPLDFPYVSPWLLLLAGLLVSIGFSIIFHKKSTKEACCGRKDSDHKNIAETIDDNHPEAKMSFGSSTKYLHTDNLQGGHFTVSFGSLEVYFDQTQIAPEGAEVSVDCSFGELKLYVPKHWKVIDKISTNLGDTHYQNRNVLGENPPTITFSGNVQFGTIEIQYI